MTTEMKFEKKWGMKPIQLQAWREEGAVGRVLLSSHGIYSVATAEGIVKTKVKGKFEYEARSAEVFPAVGDWCKLDEGNRIVEVLPRSSMLARKVAGLKSDLQIIASNIDVLFICMSLNHDYNLRRLERYLAIAGESGAEVVVLLTKADLSPPEEYITEIKNLGGGYEVIPVSLVSGLGLEDFKNWAIPGNTCAFVGSSGVGKSSLMNALMGEEHFEVGGLRNDDKGRHTTTFRELQMLDDGVMLIDTPGMREIQLTGDEGFSDAFGDIEELAENCKFRDCSHTNEPGCAVWAAIDEGDIDYDRLKSWNKMKSEARIAASRQRQKEKAAEKRARRYNSKR